MHKEQLPRRRGIVPNKNLRRYNVILDQDLADWGKHQPGGLSAWLRRLLKLSYERASRKHEPTNRT